MFMVRIEDSLNAPFRGQKGMFKLKKHPFLRVMCLISGCFARPDPTTPPPDPPPRAFLSDPGPGGNSIVKNGGVRSIPETPTVNRPSGRREHDGHGKLNNNPARTQSAVPGLFEYSV
jgi:hypothetical protein